MNLTAKIASKLICHRFNGFNESYSCDAHGLTRMNLNEEKNTLTISHYAKDDGVSNLAANLELLDMPQIKDLIKIFPEHEEHGSPSENYIFSCKIK